MKKIIIAMAAIAAAFTMASCNKEQLVEQEEDSTVIEGNCIIIASTESSLTKTSLSGNDTDGYEVFWSEDDTFNLGGNTFTLIDGAGTTSGTFQGNVPGINGWKNAYYPSSYDGSNWPTKQTYTKGNITGSPMKADVYCSRGEISGGKVEFKNVGGILRLTVKGTAKVKTITVCTDNNPNITLDCGDGVELNNTDGTVFHIAMPEGTYSGTSILFITSNSKHCIKTLKSGKSLDITRSEITPASIKIDKWSNNSQAPDGALSGTFTVADDGNGNVRKVYFSKGNLYCDDYYSFGFSSDQLSLESGKLSHFYWSKDARHSCDEKYYEYDVFMDDVLFTNADSESPNPDFTANGQKGLWRALSADEWGYLTSNNSVWTTIKGVSGLVVFCDGYTGSKTGPFQDIPDGCAFLPAAGYRKPDSYEVISSGTEGRYLTSEPRSNSESCYARALCFNTDVTTMGAIPLPESGSCVRLVTDVPDSPTPTFNVTFDMNGKPGTAPARYTGVQYHAPITKPADVTTDGYTFVGWYKDKAGTDDWDFNSDFVTSDITLYAEWRINGALEGAFTVNDIGKRVYFAKGNLWYGKTSEEAESATFNFEENQYDYGAKWDFYLSHHLRDDNHISHFMWSNNADVARAFLFEDLSVSENDMFFTNASQTTPNPDFTVNGQKGIWRTLSADEWTYLVNHNGHAWATINGVGGRIIFCDGYSGEKVGEFTEIPNGCLFLPAAGWRIGESNVITYIPQIVYHTGEAGRYISATVGKSDPINVNTLKFDSEQLSITSFTCERSYAQSVRLVTEVK